jgi:hypothetical protein
VAGSTEDQEFGFKLQVAVESLDGLFNEEARTMGIVLLVFPLENAGLCSYVTNGITPDQVTTLMKHQINESQRGNVEVTFMEESNAGHA